jgi:hypothetical protein
VVHLTNFSDFAEDADFAENGHDEMSQL